MGAEELVDALRYRVLAEIGGKVGHADPAVATRAGARERGRGMRNLFGEVALSAQLLLLEVLAQGEERERRHDRSPFPHVPSERLHAGLVVAPVAARRPRPRERRGRVLVVGGDREDPFEARGRLVGALHVLQCGA